VPHAVVEQPALQHRERRRRGARAGHLAGLRRALGRLRRRVRGRSATVARRRGRRALTGALRPLLRRGRRRRRARRLGPLAPSAAGAQPALQQPRDVLGARRVRLVPRGGRRQRLHLSRRRRRRRRFQRERVAQSLPRRVDVGLQPPLPLPLGHGRALPSRACGGDGAAFRGTCCAVAVSPAPFAGLHLLQLLLEVRVPVVLDIVVRPLRQVGRYRRPPARRINKLRRSVSTPSPRVVVYDLSIVCRGVEKKGNMLGQGSSPVAKESLEVDDELLLLVGKVAALDSRPEVVCPPQPAALAAAHQPCTRTRAGPK
jgi:hypothetical protein